MISEDCYGILSNKFREKLNNRMGYVDNESSSTQKKYIKYAFVLAGIFFRHYNPLIILIY